MTYPPLKNSSPFKIGRNPTWKFLFQPLFLRGKHVSCREYVPLEASGTSFLYLGIHVHKDVRILPWFGPSLVGYAEPIELMVKRNPAEPVDMNWEYTYVCLFKVMCYFLPWDSSPFNHHLGEYVWNFFPASNVQIQAYLDVLCFPPFRWTTPWHHYIVVICSFFYSNHLK